ncbi:hypothetical protein Tco_1549321 [Tanacetum coccineum]
MFITTAVDLLSLYSAVSGADTIHSVQVRHLTVANLHVIQGAILYTQEVVVVAIVGVVIVVAIFGVVVVVDESEVIECSNVLSMLLVEILR